jgi:hypothetical protein
MTKRFVPFIVFSIFVVYLAASVFAHPLRRSSGFDTAEFGRLPVSVNGRVQPFDSVARLTLLQIRGPVSEALDVFKAQPARPEAIDPDMWLLEILAKPDLADARRIFPIGDRELLDKLQLQPASRGASYYAFNDLGPKAAAIGAQVQRIAKVKATDRAGWENALVSLHDRLVLYERLKNSLQPNSLLQFEAKGRPFDFAEQLATFRVDMTNALTISVQRQQGGSQILDKETEVRIRKFARLFQAVSRSGLIAVVPPSNPAVAHDRWRNLGTVIVDSARGRLPPLPVTYLAAMSSAFAQGKPDVFNAQVASYRQWLASNGFAPERSRAGLETFSNRFLPFVRAVAVYAVGTVLLGVAWRTRSATVRRSATMLILLAFALHTAGLALALALTGRPSLIAVSGWLMVLTALGVERFWRRGAGTAVAAVTGLAGLVAAHSLHTGGASVLAHSLSEISLVVALAATVVVLGVSREVTQAPHAAPALAA